MEQDLLFLSGSPRPVLSVPHLLSGESSAYYHGMRALRPINSVYIALMLLFARRISFLLVNHPFSGWLSSGFHSPPLTGYVLAEMAVHQTRDFFLHRDGHLVDNKRIGADMCEHYWRHGNSRPASDMVKGLTGKGLGMWSLLVDRILVGI